MSSAGEEQKIGTAGFGSGIQHDSNMPPREASTVCPLCRTPFPTMPAYQHHLGSVHALFDEDVAEPVMSHPDQSGNPGVEAEGRGRLQGAVAGPTSFPRHVTDSG